MVMVTNDDGETRTGMKGLVSPFSGESGVEHELGRLKSNGDDSRSAAGKECHGRAVCGVGAAPFIAPLDVSCTVTVEY